LRDIDARIDQAEQGVRSEIHELTERTQARWLVAVRDFEAAAAVLGPLTALCEARGRHRNATQLRRLHAAVDARSGRQDAADVKVLVALQSGHRLGLLRTLLDADPQARDLVRGVAQRHALDPVLAFYAERLLATPRRSSTASPAPAAPAATEAFSEREVDVLRLLAQAMPNKKIARALNLSPETVKWYLSRIYAKLGVSGRDEAVARVRDRDWGAAPVVVG
jgi:LuxR family maltose regulon positive regulatory protein